LGYTEEGGAVVANTGGKGGGTTTFIHLYWGVMAISPSWVLLHDVSPLMGVGDMFLYIFFGLIFIVVLDRIREESSYLFPISLVQILPWTYYSGKCCLVICHLGLKSYLSGYGVHSSRNWQEVV